MILADVKNLIMESYNNIDNSECYYLYIDYQEYDFSSPKLNEYQK